MKLKFALMLMIPALLLAGCSRPVVRETVVERPVYIDRPAAAGATAPPNCMYASQAYSQGSMSCQDRTQYRCENGIWTRTLNAC